MKIQPMPANIVDKYQAGFYPGDGAYFDTEMSALFTVHGASVETIYMSTNFEQLFSEAPNHNESYAHRLVAILLGKDVLDNFDMEQLNA